MSGACGGPGAPVMPPVGQDPSTGRETVTQNRSVRDWTQRPRPAQDLHVSQVSLDCSITLKSKVTCRSDHNWRDT